MQLSRRPQKKPHRKNRNFSLRRVQKASKTLSLPPLQSKYSKQVNSSLIAQAERKLFLSEQSLAADGKTHFKIDGGYGDYSMGVFRAKDRKRWIKDNIPTLFDNRFKEHILNSFPPQTITQKQIDSIINKAFKGELPIRQEEQKNKKRGFESSLSPSRIQQIEDNMNGYLQIKYAPDHFIKLKESSLEPVDNLPKLKQSYISEPQSLRPSRPQKPKVKDYVFKGLGNLKLNAQTN